MKFEFRLIVRVICEEKNIFLIDSGTVYNEMENSSQEDSIMW